MTLNFYINSMQAPVWRALIVLVMLTVAARGTGALLLSRRGDWFGETACGVVVLALAQLLPLHWLPYFGRWGLLVLLFPVWHGLRAMRLSGTGRNRLLLAGVLTAVGVFTAASALLPPYSWDEQVYQTSLWIRYPGLPVLSDNPYSAYPLLPQFFLEWGRGWGGVELPRLAVWALSLMLAGKLFLESSRRCGTLFAAVLTLAVMSAPAALALQRSFYAETFVAMFAAAGWLTAEASADDRRGAFLCGLFAGACAAVKLTGCGAALALFICAFRKRRIGWLVLGVLAAALPFYLRPMLYWGNPVYPFGSALLGVANSMPVEVFFRELGSSRYGLSGLPGVVLGWLFSCFDGRIYDGVVGGFGIMAISIMLAVAAFWQRERMFCLKFAGVTAGYLFWAVSSQQTRFLYPLWFPAALMLADACAVWPARWKAVAVFGVLSGVTLSLPETLPHLRHHVTAWRILPTARKSPAEFLARVSGREYVNTLEKIAELVPHGKRVLLLFERRTLYIPAVVEHGTPFFQEKRLTPPPDSPERLFAGIGDFDYVWLGSSVGQTDHLEEYDSVEDTLRIQFAMLAAAGKVRPLYIPGRERAFPLFEVIREH